MSRNPNRGRGEFRGGRDGGLSEQQLTFNQRGRGRGSSPAGGSQNDRGRGGGRGDRGRGWGGGSGGGGVDRGRGSSRGRGASMEVEVYQPSSGVPEPDTRVTRVENETENTLKLATAKSQVAMEALMPQRPGFGTKGRKVLLWTNYFRLAASEDLLLYRYSIDVVETQSNRAPTGKKLKRVVQLFLEEHLAIHGHSVVTDFKSNILSRTDLDLEPEYTVSYRAEGEDQAEPNARTYRIRLQATGTLTVSELMDYLTSAHASQLFGSKEEVIQALNIVVGYKPKSSTGTTSVGANKHFELDAASREKFDLGAGLTALRGFFISVRAATARILVNVQVKHGAFFNDGPLVALMRAFMQEHGPNRVNLAKFVKKLSVEVTHIVKTNRAGERVPRIKQIQSFATRDDGRDQAHPPIVPSYGAGSKDVRFFLGNAASESGTAGKASSQGSSDNAGKKGKGKGKGKEQVAAAGAGPSTPSSTSTQGQYISVYDYFKQHYPSVHIADPSLPVINVGSRSGPSYLPPDVCVVLAGQPSNAKLSPSQTQQMIRFAVRKPALNAQSIATSGARLLGFDGSNNTLDAFGMAVTPKLLTVPGRVLNGPDVRYHNNKVASTRFGSWNMVDIQFTTRTALQNWTYLWISSQRTRDLWPDEVALRATIAGFTAVLRSVGVNATDCAPGIHITVDPARPETQIDDAFRRFTNSPSKPPPRLILAVLPSTDAAVYNRIKYLSDVEKGVLNVCVVASKFARANSQYHTNVALKVNLKLGGQNQALDNAKLGLISEGKTMVVGIDVTHPSSGSAGNAPSVAGIVASTDRTLAQWPADLRIQQPREEMVQDLVNLLKSRLQLWRTKNGNLPENILVYRDGVSEGQYNLVLENELPELQKAGRELYSAADTKSGLPRFTIVIVGKRHNTRFYPTRKEEADRSSNPQNGTVVDRGVTEARNWDFFLQAHAAIQGTARPAHYYIVYDKIFRRRVVPPFANAADVLEDLTHNMCYMFGRATKAVSICPPAYYADLVCERARCYLSGLFDPSSGSPNESLTSGQTGGSRQSVDPSHVRIHDRVAASMFYI